MLRFKVVLVSGNVWHCFYETEHLEVAIISILEFIVAIISTNQCVFWFVFFFPPVIEGMLTCLMRSENTVFITHQNMYVKV